MKNKKILLNFIMFVLLAAGVFLWRCAQTAFLWAGWGGFGGISMEYTGKGERALFIFTCMPLLLLFLLLLVRVRRNRIRKETISCYGKDLLFLTAAIGVGILFFYIPQPRQMIVDKLAYVIVHSGWMQYPVP